MKKILVIVFCILFNIALAQGNFQVKNENGKKFIYENGKLAKGRIANRNPLYDKTEQGYPVILIEMEVKNGLPSGDFKGYEYNVIQEKNLLKVTGDGKLKEDIFKGEIKYYRDTGEIYKKVEGKLKFNSDNLISYGEASDIHYKMIEGKIIKYYINGNKSSISKIKNEKLHGKQESYYENKKQKEIINYRKGKKHGTLKGYYENGKIRINEKYYKGKLEYSKEWYVNGDFKDEFEVSFLTKIWNRIIYGLFGLIFN